MRHANIHAAMVALLCLASPEALAEGANRTATVLVLLLAFLSTQPAPPGPAPTGHAAQTCASTTAAKAADPQACAPGAAVKPAGPAGVRYRPPAKVGAGA